MRGKSAFDIRAFDCKVHVETACPKAYLTLQKYIFPSLPRSSAPAISPDIVLSVERPDSLFQLSVNGSPVATLVSEIDLALATIKALDDLLIQRLTSLRAVHAGAVVFGKSAMVIAGPSHAGKSSMVAELLRRGVKYLSDEYALIDSEGLVHSYPRPLLLRNGRPHQVPTLPEELNASFSDAPVSVRWILSLEYQAGAVWSVQNVPQSEGWMILLRNTPHTLAQSPSMTEVFRRAVAGARCYAGQRGDVVPAADQILKLVSDAA
jgi:hypothetical protein